MVNEQIWAHWHPRPHHYYGSLGEVLNIEHYNSQLIAREYKVILVVVFISLSIYLFIYNYGWYAMNYNFMLLTNQKSKWSSRVAHQATIQGLGCQRAQTLLLTIASCIPSWYYVCARTLDRAVPRRCETGPPERVTRVCARGSRVGLVVYYSERSYTEQKSGARTATWFLISTFRWLPLTSIVFWP